MKNEPDFKYYVLNYNINKREVEFFNVFQNIKVYEHTLKAVKKYLKEGRKYRYETLDKEPRYIYGFDGFCKELDSIIMWQEWGRVQYEISVGDPFERDVSNLTKLDCYQQCEPNIAIIAREVIRVYKEFKKNVSQ